MVTSEPKELISVIIPVYNVEAYLKRCVDSVLRQTYSKLEIILVNDGSTDSSGQMCEFYKSVDTRVKVVHKQNGGLSDARNVGIDVCNGEYLMFVDSDDWIMDSCIYTLYNLLVDNNCDISVGNFKKFSKYIEDIEESEKQQVVLDNAMAVKELLYQRISTSACAKLYKRKIFEKLRYPVGKLFEDVETTYCAFKETSHIVCTSQVVYAYYYRLGSIVREKFSLKKMDYYYNTCGLLERVKLDYPEYTNAAISRKLWAEIHLIVKMGKERKEFLVENEMLWDDIKKYRLSVLKDKNTKRINKLVISLTYFGQGLLCFVYKLGSKKNENIY